MKTVQEVSIPVEIQRQCVGCNAVGVCRLTRFRIPTIFPVDHHLCVQCEKMINSIGIPTMRVQHIGSHNMQKRW